MGTIGTNDPNNRAVKSVYFWFQGVGRSVSSCGDSTKRASELRRALLERHKSEDKDFSKRQARLEEEAKVMLVKAKQAAHMQMEMERQGKTRESIIEKVVSLVF